MPARRGIQIQFGQVLREHRVAAGLSQDALAQKAELHRNYVGEVERGAKCPSLCAIDALAEALGERPSALVRAAEG
jgi:transcriptional regulator with XRE-family HTH domain